VIGILNLNRQDESGISIRLKVTIFIFVVSICVEIINSSLHHAIQHR
jgi:hypothetical protein